MSSYLDNNYPRVDDNFKSLEKSLSDFLGWSFTVKHLGAAVLTNDMTNKELGCEIRYHEPFSVRFDLGMFGDITHKFRSSDGVKLTNSSCWIDVHSKNDLNESNGHIELKIDKDLSNVSGVYLCFYQYGGSYNICSINVNSDSIEISLVPDDKVGRKIKISMASDKYQIDASRGKRTWTTICTFDELMNKLCRENWQQFIKDSVILIKNRLPLTYFKICECFPIFNMIFNSESECIKKVDGATCLKRTRKY